MHYSWDFSILQPFIPAFIRAAMLTLMIGVIVTVVGTILSIPVALAQHYGRWSAGVLFFFTDALRSIPNLVLILATYYFPFQAVLGVPAPSGLTCAIIGLTLSQIAYSADVLRGAIRQTPPEILLALRGIGFSEMACFRYAVLPFSVRISFPGQVALAIGNLKLASLASVIGVEELTFVARSIQAANFRSLEPWLAVGFSYMVIVMPLVMVLRHFEGSLIWRKG